MSVNWVLGVGQTGKRSSHPITSSWFCVWITPETQSGQSLLHSKSSPNWPLCDTLNEILRPHRSVNYRLNGWRTCYLASIKQGAVGKKNKLYYWEPSRHQWPNILISACLQGLKVLIKWLTEVPNDSRIRGMLNRMVGLITGHVALKHVLNGKQSSREKQWKL